MILQGGNLLISEIMSDPEPAVGLPPFEYVEWYNPGDDTVDLTGWQWVAGDKARRLTGGRINPGAFVVVCSPAAAPAFAALSTVIPMESFPALRNGGDRLSLINPAGIAVHTVDYSPDQFADALKADGGWSVELADPVHYCNPAAWVPSTDPSGGTPGRACLQQVSLAALEPPLELRAAGFDEKTFAILFSGILNPLLDVNNYACIIMPGEIPAPAVQSAEYGFPGLFFQLPDNLDASIIYTAILSGSIDDCAGEPARLRPVPLGFPSPPDPGSVVITEILFDPLPGQTEFVEVYNRSDRLVDLRDLILARADPDGIIMEFSNDQDLSYWLFPGCYAVFTSSEQSFRKAWPLADPAIIAERTDMPSLINGEASLILLNSNQQLLDKISWSPVWHYTYLTDNKGVALERIDFNSPGTDQSNWFSSSAPGGSTPGVENSTKVIPPSGSTSNFTLMPTVGYASSSPDPVQVTVGFHFDNTGWFMRMNIFDGTGQPVRELYPFKLAPADGIACWDGLDNAGRLVPDGIYLIVADYYHPSGKKGRWKSACAIVRAY